MTPIMLTKPEVCAVMRIAESTLDAYVADGRFPKPAHKHGRNLVWSRLDLENYAGGATVDQSDSLTDALNNVSLDQTAKVRQT